MNQTWERAAAFGGRVGDACVFVRDDRPTLPVPPATMNVVPGPSVPPASLVNAKGGASTAAAAAGIVHRHAHVVQTLPAGDATASGGFWSAPSQPLVGAAGAVMGHPAVPVVGHLGASPVSVFHAMAGHAGMPGWGARAAADARGVHTVAPGLPSRQAGARHSAGAGTGGAPAGSSPSSEDNATPAAARNAGSDAVGSVGDAGEAARDGGRGGSSSAGNVGAGAPASDAAGGGVGSDDSSSSANVNVNAKTSGRGTGDADTEDDTRTTKRHRRISLKFYAASPGARPFGGSASRRSEAKMTLLKEFEKACKGQLHNAACLLRDFLDHADMRPILHTVMHGVTPKEALVHKAVVRGLRRKLKEGASCSTNDRIQRSAIAEAALSNIGPDSDFPTVTMGRVAQALGMRYATLQTWNNELNDSSRCFVNKRKKRSDATPQGTKALVIKFYEANTTATELVEQDKTSGRGNKAPPEQHRIHIRDCSFEKLFERYKAQHLQEKRVGLSTFKKLCPWWVRVHNQRQTPPGKRGSGKASRSGARRSYKRARPPAASSGSDTGLAPAPKAPRRSANPGPHAASHGVAAAAVPAGFVSNVPLHPPQALASVGAVAHVMSPGQASCAPSTATATPAAYSDAALLVPSPAVPVSVAAAGSVEIPTVKRAEV